MRKRHNPGDYNLVANPSLPKTNNPVRLWFAFLLFGAVALASWKFFPPGIALAHPTLFVAPERVTATTQITNRTANEVTVNAHFTIGRLGKNTAEGSGQFRAFDSRDASFLVAPHTTANASVEFPLPKFGTPNGAQVEILATRATPRLQNPAPPLP